MTFSKGLPESDSFLKTMTLELVPTVRKSDFSIESMARQRADSFNEH